MEQLKGVNDLIPLTISENAMKEIQRLYSVAENQKKALRIGVKSGGCAGFSYILEFDNAIDEDAVYELKGSLKLLIHQNHIQYLKGSEVDFEIGLNNRGFVFKNPNADTTCGCGSSFG